jgi:hypothetical protein
MLMMMIIMMIIAMMIQMSTVCDYFVINDDTVMMTGIMIMRDMSLMLLKGLYNEN